jgi:large subunit ribosomal protein L3
MGGDNVTVQNLQVVGVRAEENILLVRGGIPGARGSLVVIRKAKKQ